MLCGVVRVGEVEAAMHLSPSEFESKYGFTQPSLDGPSIIVHCRKGVRSAKAATILIQQFGFSRCVDVVVVVVICCCNFFPRLLI